MGQPWRVWLTRVFRLRYLVLVAWGVLWMLPPSDYSLGSMNDWIPFEIGARTLVHYHHMTAFATPALHLYADTPQLQFGPLPILLLAMFQGFSPHAVAVGFGVTMVAIGVGCLWALESATRTMVEPRNHQRLAQRAFALGLLVVPVWSFEVGYWHHLDDVLALGCLSAVALLLARRGPWWAIAMLLGTAAATKPWFVVFLPLLFALPRQEQAKATLLTLAGAAAWWLPFIVAAPATVHSVGGYETVPDPGSILYLLGIHGDASGWLRELQMLAGLAAVAFVVRRRSWREAILVGMAVRLALDPFSYSYYVLGPLVGAMLLDLARAHRSRLPRWTLGTLALVWVLPRLDTHSPVWGHLFGPVHLPLVSALARAAWVLAIAVVLARRVQPTSLQQNVTPQRVHATTG